MISVEEAIHIIDKEIEPNKGIIKPLNDSLSYVLAKDVYSNIDMPPFRQSVMDGYALKLSLSNKYQIIGEIKAGDSKEIQLQENEAVRIFTGGLVPDEADTVVMQEHTRLSGDCIEIIKRPNRGELIRLKGQQQAQNEIALKKNNLLNEASLGFLSSLGINKIPVVRKPRVSILITGNEFQKTGKKLHKGQVYDSTSIVLKQALTRMGVQILSIAFVKDELEATVKAIESELNRLLSQTKGNENVSYFCR